MNDYYINILGFTCSVSPIVQNDDVDLKLNYICNIDEISLLTELEAELNHNKDNYINKINELI